MTRHLKLLDPADGSHHSDLASPRLGAAGERGAAARRAIITWGARDDDEDPPSIAPPVLLEPIPRPTLTEVAHAPEEPEAAVHDPYALAAAAASAMEREGRAFDASRTDPPQAPVTDPYVDHLVGAPAEAFGTETAPVAVDEPPALPRRRRPAASPLRLPVILIVVLLAVVAGIFGGLVLTRGPGGSADGVLRPVPAAVDALAARPATPFAVPPQDLHGPPGSTVGFTPDAVGAAAPLGRLHVTSEPSGAVVRLDGRVVGYTPLDAELPFGAYNAEVQLDGHTPVRQVLQLTEGDPERSIQARLVSVVAIGAVHVTAPGWDGARLVVDGMEHGHVPATLDLAPGRHVFELALGARRRRVERTVWVTRDRATQVDLTE